MEPEENSLDLIHEIYASPKTTLLAQILKPLHSSPQRLQQLLADFNSIPIQAINFAQWANFARMLSRTAKRSKNQQIMYSLGDYFIKAGKFFYPYSINSWNYQKIKPFMKIAKNASFKAPEGYSDQMHVMLYLSGEVDKKWEQGLVEYVNTNLIVDKKNQNPKNLKLNPYFSDFVSRNFSKLLPQLQRLMVRSESNLEAIVEILQSIKHFKKIGQYSAHLIKKYKNLFQTKSDICLRFVSTLTSSLTTDEDYLVNFQIIKQLLNSEHNSKKKIIYFRMLEGFVFSIKKYNLSDKLATQLVTVIANSWIKFVDDSEAVFVYQILRNALPLVTNPGPEIADACKQSYKSQNKHILLFIGLTLSAVYNKAEHFEEIGAVKESFNAIKSLLVTLLKKKEANWQVILCLINFLSVNDRGYLQTIKQCPSFFKSSCLALNQLQQKDSLRFLQKYYQYLIVQQEETQIDNEIHLTLAVIAEQNRVRDTIKSISGLQDKTKLQLLANAIYPLVYFGAEKTTKNKGNMFISLVRDIFSSLKDKIGFECEFFDRLLSLANHANLKIRKFFNLDNKKELADALIQKYLNLSLCRAQLSQKIRIEPHVRNIICKNIDILIKVKDSDYFDNLFSKLFSKKFYEQERNFIEELETHALSVATQFIDSHSSDQKLLVSLEYYEEKKQPQKKVYLGTLLDAKMMSEAQVKEQQYREHIQKMFNSTQILIEIFLRNVKFHHLIENIWCKHFDSIVHIVTYPEQRMGVYKLVKHTFENVIETPILQKLFKRYSLFLAEFYAVRGAHLTPEVSLMEKSQKFLSDFLDSDYTNLNKNSFILKFLNDLCLYVLENMEFDLSVKEQSLAFFRSAIQKEMHLDNIEELYTFLIKNLNIISNNDDIPTVLEESMKFVSPQRYTELFVEILNYVKSTKKLILRTIMKINETKQYDPNFQDYIKLRILSLDDSDDEIASYADSILKNGNKNVKSISDFDMKHFIANNSKDTIEKLCRFMTEQTNKNNIHDVFSLVVKTANQLFDMNFDQEGLEFLPYFLSLNMDTIPEEFLHKIFQILVLKFTVNEEYATLSRMSVDVGIDIIKKYAPQHGEKLLKIMESFLSISNSISNIVFLGVLAPYVKGNKNLAAIQTKITELFKDDKTNQQKSIAKSMPDLMSFFKNPEEIVENIFTSISTMERKLQSGQSYLFAGLLKGIGHKKTIFYLDRALSKEYPSKAIAEKLGRCYLLRGLIDNFGRVVELRSVTVVEILLSYMSDQNEEVRDFSKSIAQTFVTRMSSYGIKQLLPPLLEGLENEQNWRVKIAYIWILGIMANCAAKQLQTSLPIIVPTVSKCLSNAHPIIREKAAEALNLIGQTIKNPQISQTIDILIEGLQNPFQNSEKAIELLLKTRFSHYIDAPSLSLIVPILDYCLRGRVSELKEGACQVLGSISELILNPSDMLPYLRILSMGIKTAVCDPLPEIRSIAAMAIGKISSKIGSDNAREYFHYIFELVSSHSSNTTEKTGAAQAYAQIICSQDFDYFEESLINIFNRLSEQKSTEKEGYILIFLYVPAIRRAQFQGFIKEVNENTYCYVSDEEQTLRNSSMQVSRVLINNYGISHTELLLQPLCDGIFEENWRKRNAALILLGELLNILKSHMFHNKTNDKAPALYQAMMAVYIMKDDDLEMPRVTANQVWNTYIENTPKTIRSGLRDLVKMWTRFTHSASGVVFRNITGFSGKYGENYFSEIVEFLHEFVADHQHKKGVFEVLGQFIKRLSQQYLSRPVFRTAITKFFDHNIFKIENENREAISKCLALYVQKMHEEGYFESLIYPQIDKMASLNEDNPLYVETLHLVRDLLNTSSVKIVDRLIKKITTPPLSQFNIQVITNNADKISNNLYTLFKIPATEGMLEQVFSLIGMPEKENRLSLLVYCLDQVSIRLNSKYKNIYVSMIIREIRAISNGNKSYGLKAIQKILEMLVFFLNSISLSEIDSLDQLIGEITPYIFKGTGQIKHHAHRIFMILISDNKSKQTGLYYRQMIVSLENNKSTEEIWNEKDIVKDYINILVKGLAYGLNQNLQDNLEMLRFLIKETKKQIISPMILRVVGPIIRIASYPLSLRQKQEVLAFLTEVYCSGYDLQVYNHQVVSVCIRMLFQQRNSIKIKQIIAQVSQTLMKVFESSAHRQILLNLIMSKIKMQAEYLVETMCYLMETILKNNSEMFPVHTYQTLRHEFYSILTNNEFKLSMKGIYYLAKACGLITCFLKAETPQKMESLNCTYEDVLLNLHMAAYLKGAVPKSQKIELLIKQSSREKVYYLLKVLSRCRRVNTRTQQVFTHDYMKTLIPENISGFEDIIEMLEYFE